jgi:hypothetical protein
MRSMVEGRREAPVLLGKKERSLRELPSTALRAVPLLEIEGRIFVPFGSGAVQP